MILINYRYFFILFFQTKDRFDEVLIRQNLRKYGVIEKIEMLTLGKPKAYVTFTESSSAYFTVIDRKIMEKMSPNRELLFHIVPADT